MKRSVRWDSCDVDSLKKRIFATTGVGHKRHKGGRMNVCFHPLRPAEMRHKTTPSWSVCTSANSGRWSSRSNCLCLLSGQVFFGGDARAVALGFLSESLGDRNESERHFRLRKNPGEVSNVYVSARSLRRTTSSWNVVLYSLYNMYF